CLSDGKAAIAEESLEIGRQAQESERVGDDDATFADLQRHVLLAELKFLDELGIALCFLEGIEVFALEIFDQGEFEDGAVIGVADDDGHVLQAGLLSSAPAAFAGDDLEAVGARPDDERLDDAL